MPKELCVFRVTLSCECQCCAIELAVIRCTKHYCEGDLPSHVDGLLQKSISISLAFGSDSVPQQMKYLMLI